MKKDKTVRACPNCRFCKRLKHNFQVGKGYEESLCCILLLNEENSFALEVDEDSYCEEFRFS